MPSIWSRSRDHPLSSSLKRTNTHIHTLFLKQNHIVCLNPAWAFFPTLLLKYPVEHTRTADQMGRSSCRWEKRECGVRWREWGPRDCCLHQKDRQCICFKQTHVWTHLRTHNLMPSFFLKWMSAWIGDIKAGALSSFTLIEPQSPTLGFLSHGTGRAAWKRRES